VQPVVPWTWRFVGVTTNNNGSTGPAASSTVNCGYTAPLGQLYPIAGTQPASGALVAHMRTGGPPDQLWLYMNSSVLDPQVANSYLLSVNSGAPVANSKCTPAGYDSCVQGYLYIFPNIGYAILPSSNYDFSFGNLP